MIARVLTAAMTLGIAACAPLVADQSRAGRSSLGCMQAALEHVDFSGIADDHAHCIAAGLIAQRCSGTEAILASIGKEIHDVLGRGDASWRDLSADRRGMRCAKNTRNDADLSACCVTSTPVGR